MKLCPPHFATLLSLGLFLTTASYAQAQRSVSGKVMLDDCVNLSQPVSFVFASTTNATTFTRTLPLNADGSFTLSNIPSDVYAVGVTGRKWLTKVISVDISTSDVTNFRAELLSGDTNHDNTVDISDFGLLVNAYSTAVGDAGYDERADLTCDGVIDIADFGALVNTYGTTGDALPVTPRFYISNLDNVTTASKTLYIEVATIDKKIQHGDVILSIDGVECASSSVSFGTSSSNILSFQVPTIRFSNGTHTIKVQDSLGNSDSRIITFSNDVYNVRFNPIFDTSPGVTDVPSSTHITASLSTVRMWKVDIENNAGIVVKTFTGNSGLIDITWDGTNASGQQVINDPYSVVFKNPSTGYPIPPKPLQSTTDWPSCRVNKQKIGDALLIITPDALVGGVKTAREYEMFLHSELDAKQGIDFEDPISIVEIDGYSIDTTVVDRINAFFQYQQLNLLYSPYAASSVLIGVSDIGQSILTVQ